MPMPPAYHESLPYIDPQPSEADLATARDLITQEQTTFKPSPPPATSSPTFSSAIQTELDRIASATPLTPLTLSRYEAQETPDPSNSSVSHMLDVLSTTRVSDVYLSSRQQNLELLDKHGKNAWLIGNFHLENELRALEKELADTKREVDVVNIERQKRQEEVRAELQMLDETWRKGVGRVLETEVAVEELKAQIREEMRNRGVQPANEAPE